MEAYRRVMALGMERGQTIAIVAVVAAVALVVMAAEHGSFGRFVRGGAGPVSPIPGITVGDTSDRLPVVTSVRSDGAAERAGIEVGDEIVAVDGHAVHDVATLHDAVLTDRRDRRLALHIRRGDALWTIAIDRAEPPAGVPTGMRTSHGAENPAD
jgi:S1-C subfamily serine protease